MAKKNIKSGRSLGEPALVTGFLFFIFTFLYLSIQVRTELIYYIQQPAFFLEKKFFMEFLNYPGGIPDFLAAFFTQLFLYKWIGAMALTMFLVIMYFVINRLLKPATGTRRFYMLSLLPVVLLLIMHSQYTFPVAHSIALLLAISAFWLYRDGLPKHPAGKAIGTIAISLVLYYFSPWGFFLYAFLCILHDLTDSNNSLKGRVLPALAQGVLLGGIPLLAYQFFFLITPAKAYFYNLPYENPMITSWLHFSLYALIGAYVILANLGGESIFKKWIPKKKWLQVALQYILLVAILTGGILYIQNKKIRSKLLICYYAQIRQWEEILKLEASPGARDVCSLCLVNAARYHTGQMLSDLFAVEQIWSSYGLFMTEKIGLEQPLERSQLFYDLAYLNESERFASEELSFHGETPWVLQRLALINIAQGDFAASRLYLNRLYQNPFYKNWVDHYQDCLTDSKKLNNEKDLQLKHFLAPKRDFIVRQNYVPYDLKKLLASGSMNQMAFEYLMASYLLENKRREFIQMLTLMPNLDKQKLPRHLEEALTMMIANNDDIKLPKVLISQETYKNFQNFQQILKQYQGNKSAAKQTLKERHGDTYWYYLLFTKQEYPMRAGKSSPTIWKMR